MDHIKLSTAAVFLKENTSAVFIHMSFIGEYLSLSAAIDICKLPFSVSHRLSVYFSSIRRERGFIDDFSLTFRLASPLTNFFFFSIQSLSAHCKIMAIATLADYYASI